jgi:hypothetical protein
MSTILKEVQMAAIEDIKDIEIAYFLGWMVGAHHHDIEQFHNSLATLAQMLGYVAIKLVREGDGGLDEATITPKPGGGYSFTDFRQSIPGIEPKRVFECNNCLEVSSKRGLLEECPICHSDNLSEVNVSQTS